MEHSPKFDKVKNYYDKGFWKENRVHKAVIKLWITAKEYEEIIGQPYEE